jgi:hypothetical protein
MCFVGYAWDKLPVGLQKLEFAMVQSFTGKAHVDFIVNALPSLLSLRFLSFHNSWIMDATLQSIVQRFPNLEHLHLVASDGFSAVGLKCLHHLSKLTSLHLLTSKSSERDSWMLHELPSHLTTLRIYGWKLGNLELHKLQQLLPHCKIHY